jgi:hypothetical protein
VQEQRDSPLSDRQEATKDWAGKEVPTANATIAISAPIPSLAPAMKQLFLIII